MGWSSSSEPGYVHAVLKKDRREPVEMNLNAAEIIALINCDIVEAFDGKFLIKSKVWGYSNGAATLTVTLKQ